MRTSKAGTSIDILIRPFRRPRSHAGFTLIELTVAILIITVIMGLALPRIGNVLYSSDLKRSIRQLRAIFSVARSQATSDRNPRRVVCDISTGEFRIEKEIRLEGEDEVLLEYEDDNSTLLRNYQLPEGVQIEDVITETGDKETEGEAFLRIGTNGTISGNVIHLRKGEEQFTLMINALTGRITIEEGYIEEYKVADENRSM